MKIGLVGYQGSGKSTLFEWLTGVAPDPSHSHTAQSAMAPVPEPRLEKLGEIYRPKKLTAAALEIVDTPGLSRTHQGNAQKLALLREAGCLVLVVAAFDGSDPAKDLIAFEEDLLLADMEIVSGRLERIEQTLKKPVPHAEREQLEHERDALKSVLGAMEAGRPLREAEMSEEQRAATRAFRLLSEKPRMVIVNIAEMEENPDRLRDAVPPEIPMLAIPADLELELARMSPEDRREFEAEMGIGSADRDTVLRTMMEASGQMIFFTTSRKEVRAWLLPKGATALDAAGVIHTDMARGFIRAEVICTSDLIRLGSEREVKAQHLVRHEPKNYVVQDDDILFIHFST
ncbi:MAG TPA: redox-regulated ATPase YchF [Planctomycetaceae bacterium]|nr:redox-regulated ATPase YchF [Planctomycetaceae bacterium]